MVKLRYRFGAAFLHTLGQLRSLVKLIFDSITLGKLAVLRK